MTLQDLIYIVAAVMFAIWLAEAGSALFKWLVSKEYAVAPTMTHRSHRGPGMTPTPPDESEDAEYTRADRQSAAKIIIVDDDEPDKPTVMTFPAE